MPENSISLILWVGITFLNMIAIYSIVSIHGTWLDKYEREAVKFRKIKRAVIQNRFGRFYEILCLYEKKIRRYQFYNEIKDKMKKCGYRNEFAGLIYIMIKYSTSVILFFCGILVNKNSIINAVLVSLAYFFVIGTLVSSSQKKMDMKFQKYVYKIYKYLHNQISAGVRVTDAIRTVHEVVEDKWLKGILIELAGGYELTCNIDAVLDKFKYNFSTHEADTLCIAIKMGITTGDNQNILGRQEEIMFKKYFNHIQAQTDSCRVKIAAVAMVFTAIMVVMLLIPVVSDVGDAMGKIFIN